MTIHKNLYLQTEHEQKCLVNYGNKCSHHNVFNENLLCIFETNYTYMYQNSLTNEVIMFLLIVVRRQITVFSWLYLIMTTW